MGRFSNSHHFTVSYIEVRQGGMRDQPLTALQDTGRRLTIWCRVAAQIYMEKVQDLLKVHTRDRTYAQ